MSSLSILILRLSIGAMLLLGHGLQKLNTFADLKGVFPDPLGVGSQMSLTLSVFAEFFCSLFLIFGVCTRLVSVPLIINMAVAAFIFHSADPWEKKELAFAYLVPFITLFFSGGGEYSISAICKKKCEQKGKRCHWLWQ